MKAIKILLIVACCLGFRFLQVEAQSFSVKSYDLSVKGTSSLHDWESDVEKLECKGSFIVVNNALADIKDVVVTIPVRSLKSTKGKMMDNKTYDAFNHEKNPNIIFRLTGKTIDENKNALEASGTLNMAGVTKPITLSLIYKVLPGGNLEISGSKKITMTDFKMEPPTAMMGTIKVGNEIEVVIQVVLSQNSTL